MAEDRIMKPIYFIENIGRFKVTSKVKDVFAHYSTVKEVIKHHPQRPFSKKEYRKLAMIDKTLPMFPEAIYKGLFEGWKTFLSIDGLIRVDTPPSNMIPAVYNTSPKKTRLGMT
jgi:hypothetical protein